MYELWRKLTDRNRWESVWQEVVSEDGYFTIESSYLVPLFFLLSVFVMAAGLYVCDMNQAKAYLNSRVIVLTSDDKDYGSNELNADKKQLKNQLFIADLTDFSITKTKSEVKGSVRISMDIPVPIVRDWVGRTWSSSFSLSAEISDNVERLWRWSQVE